MYAVIGFTSEIFPHVRDEAHYTHHMTQTVLTSFFKCVYHFMVFDGD